jgi:hypothetical protein
VVAVEVGDEQFPNKRPEGGDLSSVLPMERIDGEAVVVSLEPRERPDEAVVASVLPNERPDGAAVVVSVEPRERPDEAVVASVLPNERPSGARNEPNENAGLVVLLASPEPNEKLGTAGAVVASSLERLSFSAFARASSVGWGSKHMSHLHQREIYIYIESGLEGTRCARETYTHRDKRRV